MASEQSIIYGCVYGVAAQKTGGAVDRRLIRLVRDYGTGE